MVPRISMIIGVDTRGKVYLSLTQSNSNSAVMGVYFNALVKKLEQQDQHWRHNTVVMLDNAAYHRSGATMKVFEELKVPVLFTGPHSYSASPAEYFFAAFKAADINPRRLKTGKG